MKKEARVTLEVIIRQLEGLPGVETGGWVRQVEETNPDDEDSVQKTAFYMSVIAADRAGIVDGVTASLVGRNRLTPSLITRGWAFWRSLLVAEQEKRAIEAAVMRFFEAQTARETLKGLPGMIGRSELLVVASIFEKQDASIRRLCADLKHVLGIAPRE